MAKNNANVNVFADQGYAVWTAPVGTALPTSPTGTLNIAFEEVGLLTDAGISESHNLNETKIYDMAGSLVRIARNQEERPITFVALEGNAVVESLRYPGSTVTTTTGVNVRPVGAATGRNLRAWVIDLVDGDVNKRIAVATGEAVWTGTTAYNGTAAATYEFTLQPYKDSSGNFFTVIDDNAADTEA